MTGAEACSTSGPASAKAAASVTKAKPRRLQPVYDIQRQIRRGETDSPWRHGGTERGIPHFSPGRGAFAVESIWAHQATEGFLSASGKRSSKATGTCRQT